MAEREYSRLTRSRSRARFALASTSRSSLWLAKDHLLQIDTSGYSEMYKRFYFRDIQALVLCRTDDWLYQAVVLAALAGIFALIAIFGGGPVMAWIFGIISGIFGFFLIFNLLSGPTSKAYLRTAVQTEKLVSLNRLRRAERAFAKLRMLIIAAQGRPAVPQPSPALQSQPSPPVEVTAPAAPSAAVVETAQPPPAEPA